MNSRIRKGLSVAALVIATGVGVTACNGHQSVQQQEQNAQTQDTQALENAQPIPHYQYSQERAALITAQNIDAQGTQTTSFFFNMGDPDPIFSCPSIGLGVPDSASLSNPEQITPITSKWGGGATTLPQMDPYGIYVPSSSSGTYVDCVNSSGQEYLVRWEGNVLTSTTGASWNYTQHRMNDGAPTVHIQTRHK